jgi:uncharacterized protein
MMDDQRRAGVHQREAFARRLVMMVKQPAAGRVKTRLARDIGPVNAAAFYRHTVAAVLSRVVDSRWETLLAVAPDTAVLSPVWPQGIGRLRQGAGDLGARMQFVFDCLPPGPVVIVGSDIPGIRAPLIQEAFRALGNHDAVFGPAPDGGYWLIGLKRAPNIPRPFGGVRWSGPHARADTMRNLANNKIAEIESLRDVDEGKDITEFGGTHGRRVMLRTGPF